MKTAISKASNAGFRFTAMIMVSAIIGAASAGTEIHQYGGSTTTSEQSGGSGASKTLVSRYKDGQTVITHDGSSTDVSIQRRAGSSRPAYSWEYPLRREDRFDRRPIDERLSGMDLGERNAAVCPDYGSASAGEEFKRRLLNRMRDHLPE